MGFRVEHFRPLVAVALAALFASQLAIGAHSHEARSDDAAQPTWSSTDPAPGEGGDPSHTGLDCELCRVRALFEDQAIDAPGERVDRTAASPEALFSVSRAFPRQRHFLAALPTRGPPLS